MKRFFKENIELLGAILIGCNGLAYGISDFIPFFKGVSILLPLSVGVLIYLYKKDQKTLENIGNIQKLEDIAEEQDALIQEQKSIIEEYETIFDSQLVELPCVCGNNTFKGLFSPKTPNLVTCEKCSNTYRVEINYDSVLISEPMDLNQTFDKLVGTIS